MQEQLETLKRKQEVQRAAKPDQKAPTAIRQLVGFTLYPILMILGALVGGSLWGLYWVVTGVMARMHAEDAFAALRIKNYKNFLRLKIEPDKLTIYPLGIDRIPAPTIGSMRRATATTRCPTTRSSSPRGRSTCA